MNTSTGNATTDVQSKLTADQTASKATNNAAPKNDVSSKTASTILPEQPANTVNAQATVLADSVQPVMNLFVKPARLAGQPSDSSVDSPETTKPATAWQPEPPTNYSADHTAKIDMTNQPTTVHGDNWQMNLDKNYIKAGQGATLTVKYKAQAGDTFVLDIGYPAKSVNVQSLNSQIGMTSTKNNGLRTQVTNIFKQAGTYTQIIKLDGWNGSAEGFKALRRVFGDQAFDLTLKRGTSLENVQDAGRLYLISSFTPTMNGTGSVGVDQVDTKYVPVLSTNNNYIFSVRTNWSDFGTVLDPSYNGDFVYSISVPKTFELDQAATEAFYQQIRNHEPYYRWGNRGSNVTVSQAGVGAPVIIKTTALNWVGWHYSGNEGVSFLGHFVDAPSVATTVTAEGQTTVSDTIGDHTQTIILPEISAKVIKAADYNYADSGATVFLVSDYGDDNQLYQSHEVPMTGNGNSIRLIHDLALVNNSPFDIKNATVTLTFGDGLHVDVDSVRNNSYISNLLDDKPTHPNREMSFLVTYQDGTSEMVSANSKGDPTKNIKSITLTRDWNAGQMAGIHGDGIRGFVAKMYQDGSPVKVGDAIKVSLTVAGINTAGHNVFKTISDTLKVVDQQFAPLTTESLWGGVDKTALGANPSGTINMHWKRTSGEQGRIQLENPTIYFVMPNTVAKVKNPRWGSGKDAPGNAAPTLTSITYEKSKDGENTVAIMHFSGALIDQDLNNSVPLYFDTVNKDNATNQASEGFLYWTADNVNADGLTKIDPTRLDSQNKSAHLPADLSQEQLSKIYLHSPYWGTINMATGMYSTSATKTATMPWQTQTIVDYHGDGQADVGVNLVNDTSNELHNVVAIINLPKATNNSSLTANLTGNTVELIDPNTDSKLTDGATVLYSMKAADLSSNDLSSFVTADQVVDWSKVQAVAVTLQTLGSMASRQVQIPVVVKDLVANAGKTGTIGTRVSADELKPIIVAADTENAAKLVVGGQATIQARLHYQDAQGKDHYLPLADHTRAYDILQGHILNGSDFTPSATDLAQVPGYELSKVSPTVISGKAVIGQPVTAPDDGSVLQFELVPSAQKVLINYVDDDDNQKVIKTDTLTGKTGETQKINVVAPNNYVLVDPAVNPSEYTFLARDNKPITIHLKHKKTTTQEEKTVTRAINLHDPHTRVKTIKQAVKLTRTATVDEVTGETKYGNWTTGQWEAYIPEAIPGYTASQPNVAQQTVTGTTEDQTINITYTANPQTIHINYVDAQRKLIHTTTVNGQTDQTVEVPNEVPDGWMLYSGQSIPKSITFQAVNNDRDYVVKHVQSFVLSTAPKKAGTIIEGTKAKTYPAGVSDADLNKTVTRTILIKDANGRTVNTKTQTVHFVRNAIVDAVTGHVDYLGWSEDGSHIFAAYVPVPKNGYTINSAKTVTVTPNDTDSTVELTYKPIPKTITVEYMTTDGKQVASQDVKADDNNQVKFVAPNGYVLATNTNTVDVSDLNDNIYRVLVRANEKTYTAGSTNIPKNVKNLTKVVTRTIVIVMPNGHRRTIKQRVTFERTATVKSDGSVVYTDYQPVGHDAFNHIFVAHRFGYNLNFSDGSKIVARVDHVTADTPDQTIVVTYVRKNAN